MRGTPRHRLVAVLVGFTLPCVVAGGAVAAAKSPPQPFHPRADHVGVVITAGEVFVSWGKVAGGASANVVVRRGQPACPRTPDQGSAAGEATRRHVIDRSVKAGAAYCYTIFLEGSTGTVTTVATTGLVTVPDVGNVPPAHVPAPAAAPTVTVSRVDPALMRRIEVGVGVAVALSLVLLIALRSARRVSNGRMVLRPTMRESLVSRNSSALVVPAMIALGWIGIVIGFVVLR
jgi:hypothetical protein